MPPGALLRWAAGIYLALAVAAVVWLGVRDGTIPLSVFVDPEAWPIDLAVGAVTAAALVGLWQIGVVMLPSARELERVVAESVGRLNAAEIVTLALLSGFAEELFFRGALQSQWGIVPATVLFALLHMGPGRELRLWPVFALVAGAALGAVMLWRGNLMAPAVAHVVVNMVGLARLQTLRRPASGDGA